MLTQLPNTLVARHIHNGTLGHQPRKTEKSHLSWPETMIGIAECRVWCICVNRLRVCCSLHLRFGPRDNKELGKV